MSVTDRDLIRLRSQAEFMALSATKPDWRQLADALAELDDLRQLPEGTLIQRQGDNWVLMTPDGKSKETL